MSWESTVPYYTIINRQMAQKYGGLTSAKILLHSVNFAELEALMQQEKWEEIADILTAAAQGLEKAGAELIIICTNTMHIVADQIESNISIPLIRVTDAVGNSLRRDKIGIVALLGTRFTMQKDFYKSQLWDQGVEILLPNEWQMQEIDRIIFEELCKGILSEVSKTFFLALIDTLAHQGAQAIILGCTEIGLLIQAEDSEIPLLDTTEVHALYAAQQAMKKK